MNQDDLEGFSSAADQTDNLEWLVNRSSNEDELSSSPARPTIQYSAFRAWIRRYIENWPAKDRKTLAPVIRRLTLVGSKLAPKVALAMLFCQLVESMSQHGILSLGVSLDDAHRVLDSQKSLSAFSMRGNSSKMGPDLASCLRPFQLILIASFASELRRLSEAEADKESRKNQETPIGDSPSPPSVETGGVCVHCEELPYGVSTRNMFKMQTVSISKVLKEVLTVLFRLLRPQDEIFRSYVDTWYYGGGQESETVESKRERERSKLREQIAARTKKSRTKASQGLGTDDVGNDSDDPYDDNDDTIELLLPDDEDDNMVETSLFEESLNDYDVDDQDDERDRITRRHVMNSVRSHQQNATASLGLIRAILRVTAEYSEICFSDLYDVLSLDGIDILGLVALIPHASILLRPWVPPSNVQNTRFVGWASHMSSGLARDCITLYSKVLGFYKLNEDFYEVGDGRMDVTVDKAYCQASTILACKLGPKLIPHLRLALRSSAKLPQNVAKTGPSSRSQSAILSFLNQETDSNLGAAVATIGMDPYWKRFQVPKWIADWLIHFVFDTSIPLDLSFADERASSWTYGRFILPQAKSDSGVLSYSHMAASQTPECESIVQEARTHLLKSHLADIFAMSLTLSDDSIARPNKILGVRMLGKILNSTPASQLIETGWGFIALESLQRTSRFKEEPEIVDASFDVSVRLFAVLAPAKYSLSNNKVQHRIDHDIHSLQLKHEQAKLSVGYLNAYDEFRSLILSGGDKHDGMVEIAESLEKQKMIELRAALEGVLVEEAFNLTQDDSATITKMRQAAGLPNDSMTHQSEQRMAQSELASKNPALNNALKSWIESYLSELQYLAMSPPDDNAGSSLGEAASAGLLLNALSERRWLKPLDLERGNGKQTSRDEKIVSSFALSKSAVLPPVQTKLQLARTYARISNTILLALGPEGISEFASQILPPLFTLSAHHDIIVRAPSLHAIGLALEICGSRLRVHARNILTWLVETYIILSDSEFIETVASLRYGLRGWIQARSPALLEDANDSAEDSDDVANFNEISAVANVIAEASLDTLRSYSDNDDDEKEEVGSLRSSAEVAERRIKRQYERWKAANSPATNYTVEEDDYEQFKAHYNLSSEDSRLEDLLERYRVRKTRYGTMTTAERYALGRALESELEISREFIQYMIVQLFVRVGADVDLLDALRTSSGKFVENEVEGENENENIGYYVDEDDADELPEWLPGLGPLGENVMVALEDFYLSCTEGSNGDTGK